MRTRTSAAIALIAALMATGCSRSDSPTVTIQSVDAVAEATASAGSARLESAWTFDFSGVSYSYLLSGVVDFERDLLAATNRLEGAEGFLPAGSDPEGEIRAVDGVLYHRGSMFAPFVDEDVWLSTPLEGGSVAALTTMKFGSPADPGAVLDAVRAVADLTLDGEEDLRGTRTSRYAGTVDASKIGAFGSDLGPEETEGRITIWVDEEHRLRRLLLSFDLPMTATGGPGGSEGGTVTADIEVYDYGVPVVVTAPPAEQVRGMMEIMRDQVEAELDVPPAPAGGRPERVPESIPEDTPFPVGTSVVSVDEGPSRTIVTLSTTAEDPPQLWAERVAAFYELELHRHGWRVTGSGTSSSSGDGGTTELGRTFDVQVGDLEGRVEVDWERGADATTITMTFRSAG